MNICYEVISKFQEQADADHLLYTPIHQGLTSRHSRVYQASVSGDEAAAQAWLKSVLVDSIAQEVSDSGTPMLNGALFVLDYGMKPGALDLEKEAILQNFRGRGDMPFKLESLKIVQRVYIFGSGDKAGLSARFAKDICNPAIHYWTIS